MDAEKKNIRRNFGTLQSKEKLKKINLYPYHLEELLKALTAGKKSCDVLVSDDTTLACFSETKLSKKALENLCLKYNLDDLKSTDYIYSIIEKMHDYRPF